MSWCTKSATLKSDLMQSLLMEPPDQWLLAQLSKQENNKPHQRKTFCLYMWSMLCTTNQIEFYCVRRRMANCQVLSIRLGGSGCNPVFKFDNIRNSGCADQEDGNGQNKKSTVCCRLLLMGNLPKSDYITGLPFAFSHGGVNFEVEVDLRVWRGKTNHERISLLFPKFEIRASPFSGSFRFQKKAYFFHWFSDFNFFMMQGVKNFIQSKALGVAEYITPVLKVIHLTSVFKTGVQFCPWFFCKSQDSAEAELLSINV